MVQPLLNYLHVTLNKIAQHRSAPTDLPACDITARFSPYWSTCMWHCTRVYSIVQAYWPTCMRHYTRLHSMVQPLLTYLHWHYTRLHSTGQPLLTYLHVTLDKTVQHRSAPTDLHACDIRQDCTAQVRPYWSTCMWHQTRLYSTGQPLMIYKHVTLH